MSTVTAPPNTVQAARQEEQDLNEHVRAEVIDALTRWAQS